MSESSQNNTKNGKLLPCPFCKGEDLEIDHAPTYDVLHPDVYEVHCVECGGRGGEGWTEAEAIAAWNSRVERTCRNISDEYNEKEIGATSFCCSECGAHYEDAESYYAFLASDDDITHWCPSCGAKVVDK